MSQGPHKFIRVITQWLDNANDPMLPATSDFDQIRRQLKPADVILVEGSRPLDRTLQKVSGSTWTQALLYIGRPMDIADPDVKNTILSYVASDNDTPLVLETTLHQGVVVRPLSDFERFNLRICRPRSVTPADALQVIRYAASRLGPRKSVLHFMDLMRFFIPWWMVPRQWRVAVFRYNPGRHTRFASCALIADAFSFIQYPILPLVKVTNDHGTQLFRRQVPVCLPADIESSPYFEIIKPTYLDFATYKTEELFPWKGSGVFTTDDAIQQLPEIKPRNENVLAVKFREHD